MIYSNCKIVSGIKRSTICDLQRNRFDFIPNSLAKLFNSNHYLDIDNLKLQLSIKDREIIDQYCKFLLDSNYAFWCDKDEIDLFPKLEDTWDFPGSISNAIIDFNKNSTINIDNLILQLEDLGCQFILLRSYCNQRIHFWQTLLKKFDTSTISSIEILSPFHGDCNKIGIKYLIDLFPRLRSFVLTSSKEDDIEYYHSSIIICNKRKVDSPDCCGTISLSNFMVNEKLYSESQQFNNCLNRKITIDSQGYIKNCPSMKTSYGNIENTTLKEVLSQENFKKPWNIKKDSIDTCKVCEFRYICIDCRAFMKDKDIYSKPIKCNYNPYEANWT